MYRKLVFLLLLFIPLVAMAQKTRIQGRIFDDQKRPLGGALVVDKKTQDILAASDDDGNYSALVTRGQILVFESIGTSPKEVKVGGEQILDVVLPVEAIKLDEVEVVSKIVTKIIPEPTEIEIKGNYFHLRTRVRVPKEMAKSNTRMIFQPFIADVTTGVTKTLRPMILDGREYDITQKRMYDYDLSKDTLITYRYIPQEGANKELLPYHDSIYVEDQTNDYRGEVLISLENYNKAFYRDSFVIAKGTVNPLRFYEYSVDDTQELDSSYIPKPALQLMNDRGEVELVFETGKAKIDQSVAKNAEEIQKINRRFALVENDPNSSLKSFLIAGQASPDGVYEKNLALAKARMRSASNEILSQLRPDTREYLEVETEASVAPWSEVVVMLKADSLYDVAEKVEEVIDRYPNNINAQSRRMRQLPEYKVIAETYLPKLRKVAYEFDYSVFRVLNIDEIRDLYNSGADNLTRYEYYQLVKNAPDTASANKFLSEALAKYPKFLYAAHVLAKENLKKGEPDVTVLEGFVEESDAPVPILMTQALTMLNAKQYSAAQQLIERIPASQESESLRSIIEMFNGDYQLGYEREAGTNSLNEVLLLLAMKRNDEAWEKAQKLPAGVAKNEYVKAIAANRLDKVGEALLHLDMAFALDPSLEKVASVDGDVNDLLE